MTEALYPTFAEKGTTKKFNLGATITDSNGTTWQYGLAAAAIAQGQIVSIDSAYSVGGGVTHASMDSGATPTKLGVYQLATSAASGEYIWVAIKGPMSVNLLASAVAGAKLYTSASPGSLDDASASQTLIPGLTANTTVGGAPALTACFARVELSANCYA